jgi:general secretion pathway protein A
MVLSYYRLRESPFGVTPGRGDLFASGTHREALASLLYGLDSGLGFVALVGQPGMGKTTILFEILRRLRDSARTIFIFQTIVTPTDLLRALLIELDADDPELDLVHMQARLNQIVTEQAATGKRLVVIIDEAQNLDDSVLELLRMLSNFETASDKLMQIVLSGQMQLKEKLARPELLQMRQRISILAYLQPLSASETSAYIDHRLRIAGYTGTTPLFLPAAVNLIAEHSSGIPRNINNICFNALSLGCALDRTQIGADVIRQVLQDLDMDAAESSSLRSATERSLSQPGIVETEKPKSRRGRFSRWKIAVTLSCIVLLAAGFLLERHRAVPDAGQGEVLHLASQKLSSPAPGDGAPAGVKTVEAKPASSPDPELVADQTDSVAASSPAMPSPATSGTARPQTRLIHMREGQTLYSICRSILRDLGQGCLDRIQELNPSVDLDYLQKGQRIRLPVLKH